MKPRRLFRLGMGCPESRVGVLNSSIDNLERSVLERVFYCKDDGVNFAPPTQPNRAIWWGRLMEFRRRTKKALVSTTPVDRISPYYLGRKRTLYEKAESSLEIGPVDRRDSHLKVFVKCEKGDFEAKPDPVPRVIQPRDPRYNVELGRYLKPMEHRLYHAINEVFGYVVVTKGMNMPTVAALIAKAWSEFNDPVAVLADANRFDQHVHETALRWEHSIYLSGVAPNERAVLGRLLSWQIRNIATGYCEDGFLRFKVTGRRCSGDMNTAMGNVVLMCGMLWEYIRSRGVKVRIVNNGDDSVFIMEKRDLGRFRQGLEQWFLEMGFSMAISAPVYHIEQIKFCQAHPIFDGSRWMMIRDPRSALPKDSCSMVAWDTPNAYRAWCAAIADCGEALAGDLPIFCEFYRFLKRSAGGRKAHGDHPSLEGGLYFEAKKMGHEARKFGEPTDDSRVAVWQAFGISPDEQVAIERYYSSLTLDCDLGVWPVTAHPTDPEYLMAQIQLPL